MTSTIKNNKFYPSLAQSALEFLKHKTGSSEQALIIALKEQNIVKIVK